MAEVTGLSPMEQSDEPRQFCGRCGIGPFFFVPARGKRAELCMDCADIVHGKLDG